MVFWRLKNLGGVLDLFLPMINEITPLVQLVHRNVL